VTVKYIDLEIFTGLCGLSSSEYEKVISRTPSFYLYVCMYVCISVYFMVLSDFSPKQR
jgi:hypothetical protein